MNLKKYTISLLAALACHTAWADGELTPAGLAAKYPPGSIQNEDAADQALREVDQQRGATEQKFATEEHDCYSKFFATDCLDAAKEERRVALAQIRKVEVDANAYIRSARAVDRDRKLAVKREHDAANPPTPLTTDVPPKQNNSQTDQHDPNEGARRIAEHDAKVKAQQQQEAAQAPERAAKVETYNKKVADAEQRQRDVAQKKAEKQKQADEKAAKAAKAQKDAAAKKQPGASTPGASTPGTPSPSAPAPSASAPAAASASASAKP